MKDLALTPPAAVGATALLILALMPPALASAGRVPQGAARPGHSNLEVEGHVEVVDAFEQLRLASTIQSVLRRKLLTPEPAWAEAHAQFLASHPEDGGLVRITRERHAIDGVLQPLGKDGNGAYYSFHTRTHSAQGRPMLSIDSGYFSTQYGSTVVPIGEIFVTDLPMKAEPVPSGLSDEAVRAWQALWIEPGEQGPRISEDLPTTRGSDPRGPDFPDHGQSYLFRAVGQRGVDELIAFQHLATDRLTVTLLWKRLHVWSRSTRSRRGDGPARETLPPEDPRVEALNSMTPARLIAELKDLRERLQPAIFRVSGEHRATYEARIAGMTRDDKNESGMCRIYRRDLLAPLVERRYGGASVVFGAYDTPLEREEDALLSSQGYLQSLGDVEAVLDLGALSDHELRAAIGGNNPLAGTVQGDAWDLIRALKPTQKSQRASLTAEQDDRLARLGDLVPDGNKLRLGYSFLLRKVSLESKREGRDRVPVVADRTTLVTVVALDDYGATLAWHRLP